MDDKLNSFFKFIYFKNINKLNWTYGLLLKMCQN